MPLDFGTSVPVDDMPQDLLSAADEADAMIGDELAAMVPPFDKPIHPKVMGALTAAVAEAAAVMGFEVIPETYSEPVREMDAAVVRFLAMIDAAAKDYGQPLPVRLDELRTEQDITALTASIIELAADASFVEFLDMPAEGEDADVSVDIEVGGPGEVEEDFNFAGRL